MNEREGLFLENDRLDRLTTYLAKMLLGNIFKVKGGKSDLTMARMR